MWWFIKITCFPCPVNHWHALTSMQNKSALIHPIQPSSSFKGCVSVAGLLSFARGPWVQNRDDYLKIVMHVSMSTSAHVSRSQGFVPSLALSLLPLSHDMLLLFTQQAAAICPHHSPRLYTSSLVRSTGLLFSCCHILVGFTCLFVFYQWMEFIPHQAQWLLQKWVSSYWKLNLVHVMEGIWQSYIVVSSKGEEYFL